ncbi:RNA polymerase sigma factor [Catenovulum sp. SX2]|uniref:RNA polymerase sigma factor n=1 Tax=Catenovulum sp. SX2 TaxID=3398614 RepID=UPI003F87CDBB
MSMISRIFVEKSAFLKNFLKKFIGTDQDVDDILQEVYLKAHQIENRTDIKNPTGFLVQIAKNIAIDELNKKARQATGYIDEHLDEIPIEKTASLESEEEAEESIRLYCQAIEQLPEACQKALILRKVYGLKHKEIAEKLGVSVSTVEKNLKLAGLFCDEYLSSFNLTTNVSTVEKQTLLAGNDK